MIPIMKATTRVALITTAGVLAAMTMSGCSSAPPEERAQELAIEFITWGLDVATPDVEKLTDEDIASAIAENPFDGLCAGADERVLSETSWITQPDSVGEAKLLKAAGGEYWISVATAHESGDPANPVPVRVATVDGELCVDDMGDSAELG